MAVPTLAGAERREATGGGEELKVVGGNKEGCVGKGSGSGKDRSHGKSKGVGAHWQEWEGGEPWGRA